MDETQKEHKELVRRIRTFENEWAMEHTFKRYRNYHVPEELVKKSKKVLSFGVGNEVKFEKFMCLDNRDLQVWLFDPTPHTVSGIGSILHGSGKTSIANEDLNIKIIEQLKYKPIAYAPVNGTQQFYYPKETVQNDQGQIQEVGALHSKKSFSLFNNHIKKGHVNSVQVKCQNLQSIMEEIGWNDVDIIKTDIEGMWWDFGQELLDKNIKFKYWVTEIEFKLGYSDDEILLKMESLCKSFKDRGYKIYVNRKRGKPMSELIFLLPHS